MATTVAPERLAGRAPRRGVWLRDTLRTVEGVAGTAIIVLFLFVLVFGPTLAPYGPTAIGAGLPSQGPSAAHWLGTDSLGRDVLSRLLAGGRSVILVPILATVIAFLVGGLAGMFAGYAGRLVDTIFSRAIDLLLSIPPLLTALVVIASLGSSTPVLVIATAFVYAPRIARILRGATLSVVGTDYVRAAQARGERSLPIILREILPNILPTVFVEFAIRLTFCIIFMATINFLGLGSQPPSPNWGLMVAESRATISIAPVATLAPAVAIALLSAAIGLIADAATQALDRQSRTGRS